ncbi:hypothetical protein Nekkels1_43 [Cellulophaga phage Nekkels_1]|uniref:Uncharacterized protein n=1 Tax=Cellulophaga phage Nekkels_1 TaxID=2745692 RepID=A0A8E4UXI4_9CAUD|nr:hypothetical protein M1M31_gp43 [Cellulophaga phage Nekkels_1]QQO97045.1 hypothetical protein Nekkels1_43 [Cellulophaga phage Nekkels_1]QQO97138.1 hypothetical protein Nekkels2_43 [Cellulophaga phage Nekkels_2]
MANILKDNPVGIDSKINQVQKSIYPILVSKWGEFDLYGRVYKIVKGNKTSLEIYVGNGEYKKILFSEGNKMFFIQGDKPTFKDGFFNNSIWIISILNIEKIKNIIHRADEEVHNDLITSLSSVFSFNDIIGLEYGMNNIKRIVEDVYDYGTFKASDIHPYHVFSVELNVQYSLIDKNC